MAYKNKAKNKAHIKSLQANPTGWRLGNKKKAEKRRQEIRAKEFGISPEKFEQIMSKLR